MITFVLQVHVNDCFRAGIMFDIKQDCAGSSFRHDMILQQTFLIDWSKRSWFVCVHWNAHVRVCVCTRMQHPCHEIITLRKSAPTTSRSCRPHFVLCSALTRPFWGSCGVSRATAEWPLPGRESTHSHGTHSIELGWIDASFLIAPFLSPSASLVKAASAQPCCKLVWL